MKIRISVASKIFLTALLMCVFLIGSLMPLAYIYSEKYINKIIAGSNDISEIMKNSINNEFESMIDDTVKIIAKNTAESANHMLPKLTLKELATNEEFRTMALKRFYKTGYTAIVEPDEYFIAAHFDPRFNGKFLVDTPGYDEGIYKPLVNAYDEAVLITGMQKKYKFISENGEYKDKTSYIERMSSKTKDGHPVVLMATVSNDEFEEKGGVIKSILSQKTNELTSFADTQSEWYILGVALVVVIIFVLTLIFGLSLTRSVSKNLVYLTDVCKKTANGDFASRIEIINSRDEIEDLSISIENMRESLNKQAETIKLQSEKERERAKELEEALEIAEEKTKQLINQTKA